MLPSPRFTLGFCTKFTRIKFFLINLCTITAISWQPAWFHIFFHHGLLGVHIFYSWPVFGLDFTSFEIVCCKAGILPLMVAVICPLFFFTQADMCSALHVNHDLKFVLYVHVNDCRVDYGAAKYMYTCSSSQYKDTSSSNESLSTKLNSLRMTYKPNCLLIDF